MVPIARDAHFHESHSIHGLRYTHLVPTKTGNYRDVRGYAWEAGSVRKETQGQVLVQSVYLLLVASLHVRLLRIIRGCAGK